MLRRSAAGLLAGLTALSLVAATTTGTTTRAGTAQTSLLGAELEVTNLGSVPVVRVLDAATYASTDTDAARNVAGAGSPFAAAGIVPITVGSTAFGSYATDSTGASSGDGAVTQFGDVLSAVGVDVAPIEATATATVDSAVATVDTLVADVSALLGALGVDINVSALTSQVTQNGASAIQGVQVSAISVSLADLGLDADLLGQLPLGDLLDLLDQLPLSLPADVEALVDSLLAQLAELDDVLADVAAAGTPLAAAADGVVAIDAILAELTVLDGLYDGLAALDSGNLLVELTAFLGGLGAGELAILDACYGGDLVADLLTLDPPATVAALLSCVGADMQALAGPVLGTDDALVDPATALVDVEALRDTLLTTITGLVDGLPLSADALETAVTGLLGDTSTLGDLLDTLLGLLPDIAGTELLSIGAFDVGIVALATDDVATSAASVACSAIDVTVLGQTFSTPDCSDGLAAISDALAGLDDAVNGIVALLNSLPIGELLQVGSLSLDVFGGLTESVSSANDYITATAGLNLLELELPSITLDPTAIAGDLVGGLELPDVVGVLTGAIDDAQVALGDLAGVPSVDDALTVLGDLETGIAEVDGLVDQVTALVDALGLLDLDTLGTLATAFTTPGLRLLVDPVSTAEFTTATAAPAPAPDPTEDPDLPTTGGGAIVLGLLALGGAAGLRRRR